MALAQPPQEMSGAEKVDVVEVAVVDIVDFPFVGFYTPGG
jgi:hypothetical protein